jgi:hypothetical protein
MPKLASEPTSPFSKTSTALAHCNFHKNKDSLWLDQLLYINAIPNNTQEKHTSKYLVDATKLVNLLKFFFWAEKTRVEFTRKQ